MDYNIVKISIKSYLSKWKRFAVHSFYRLFR